MRQRGRSRNDDSHWRFLLEELDATKIGGPAPDFGHSPDLIGSQDDHRDDRRHHHADLQGVRPDHRSNTTLAEIRDREKFECAFV